MSDPERRVWKALHDWPDDAWVVIHSLWLRTHERKLDAEADFVLIGPPGVLVLEVKGGIVERAPDGLWLFKNTRGHLMKKKNEGPFAQARGAMYGLRTYLQKNREHDLCNDHVWGYGVVTTDCTIRIPPNEPEMEPWMALGELDFPEQLPAFVARLAKRWRDVGASKGYRGEPCAPATVQKLVRLFRPAVGYVTGLGVDARRAEKEICRLTGVQCTTLEMLARNDRVVLRGGAGTGKTMLAVEQARRQAASGHRVLFVCFNRHLAEFLRGQAADEPELQGVQFYNYHQLVGRLLTQAGQTREVPEDWQAFNAVASELVLEAIEAIPEWKPYDALIIDEAQDLMAPAFMDLFDLLLDGGLVSGTWTMCIDPNQVIFAEQYEKDFADRIESLGTSADLTENCRNTRPISAHVYGLGQLDTRVSARTDGPSPRIEYYGDRTEFRRKIKGAVNRIVDDFREAGLNDSDVVVLLARKGKWLDDLKSQQDHLIAPLVPFGQSEGKLGSGVAWATVQAFKGLEAKAVVLAGLESLRDFVDRRLFYVGASRAHSVLTVLLPKDAEESVQLGMEDVLRRLTDGHQA